MKFNFNLRFRMLMCGLFATSNPNWIHDTRPCDSYEIFYVTAGTLYIAEGDNKYILHPGDYLITPPTLHQYGWKPSSCSFYWFHFYYNESGNVLPSFKGTYDSPEIIEKYAALMTLDKGQTIAGDHLIIALLSELQNSALRQTISPLSDLCKAIQLFIQVAPANQLKVSSISDQFGYNAKYLSHCFCNETGISLKKQLTKEMMHRAENLLTGTTLSISQISEYLGYPDAHTFSHAFRREHDNSPKDYRKTFSKTARLNDR
ncbi:MAG: AraC family transcriptional regulator [bacterium]|nr:AraC family transcriptional regulator [bacterium]